MIKYWLVFFISSFFIFPRPLFPPHRKGEGRGLEVNRQFGANSYWRAFLRILGR
jgi:hypothetical protein